VRFRFPPIVQGALLLLAPTALLAVPSIVDNAGPLLRVAWAKDGTSDIRTFVTLHVNTIDQGETVAVIRGDDVLIPLAALEQAGVHNLGGKRETLHGETYVLLSSLKPDVTFKLNIDDLSLDVTVAPSHFGTVAMNVYNIRPKGIVYTSSSSSYINYALAATSGGTDSAFFDGGVNHAQDSFHYSFTAQRDDAIRRGLIYYQMDDRDGEVRRVIGDLAAASGDLGGSSFIAGYGVSRDFSLDPYAIHFPLPSLSGVVTSPSVANVYINGVLVQRLDLPPGAFNLNQLPITAGNGNAQVVVTDAFGRSTTYSQQYYAVPQILTPGITDFQYAAGLLRQNAFAAGDSYGPAAAVGQYRVGVNDSLTVGGRFEATPNMVSAGPAADFRTPIGLFHVAAAASADGGYDGLAGEISYQYTAPRFGLGGSVFAQGPYYANISQPLNEDRPTFAVTSFASVPLGRMTFLTFQYSRRKMRDSGTNDQLGLFDTITLPHGYSVTLSAQRNTSTTAAPTMGFTSSLNMAMGRTTATVTSQTGTTKDSGLQIQQSPPGRYGLSAFAVYDPSYNHSLNGSMLYSSQYGNAEVDYSTADGSSFTDAARLSGGVAFIDGGTYPTAPVLGSFALVDVPDTPGVEVYLENQPVGKTNGNGKLLVTDLLPNYGNPIRIDDKDVPVNTSIQTVERLIAPPDQAGAVVTFAAQRLVALTGNLLITLKGRSVVPKFGQLEIEGHDFDGRSVLGENGEFYLENVPPGTYAAHILFADGECRFEFTAPSTDKALVRMGTLQCAMP
jgi:outer membrane usher protein